MKERGSRVNVRSVSRLNADPEMNGNCENVLDMGSGMFPVFFFLFLLLSIYLSGNDIERH